VSVKTLGKPPGGAGISVATGTYTGDGLATQAIVGVGFQPRFVWIYKEVALHNEFAVKTNQDALNAVVSDRNTVAQTYTTDMIISLDADGFTVGDGTGLANYFNVNLVVYTYICWR